MNSPFGVCEALADQLDSPITRVLYLRHYLRHLVLRGRLEHTFSVNSEGLAMESEERLNVLDPQALKPIGLTQRESEVLAWVAEGKSNNDVGLILGIRSVTVKKHLEHIFEKMGVETRTAAVAFAIRASRRTIRLGFFPFGYIVAEMLDIDLTFVLEALFST